MGIARQMGGGGSTYESGAKRLMAVPADDRDRVRAALARPPAPRGQVKVGGVVYELVGEEERVDPGWEERNAERTKARWEDERDERLARRRADRERRSMGRRLDRAIAEIGLLEGKAARAIASSRTTGEGSPGGNAPPKVSGPDVSTPLTLIARHLRAIEDAIDAELGLLSEPAVGDRPGFTSAAEGGRMLSTADRDCKVFDELQGIRSDLVARDFPHLGKTARTIERARVAEAERRGLRVRAVDGVVLGEISDGERVLRRVRIT